MRLCWRFAERCIYGLISLLFGSQAVRCLSEGADVLHGIPWSSLQAFEVAVRYLVPVVRRPHVKCLCDALTSRFVIN